MSQVETFTIDSIYTDEDGSRNARLHPIDGGNPLIIRASWLDRHMKTGDTIRGGEIAPAHIRFREITAPNWLEDPNEDLNPKEPTPVTNVSEGEQFPPEEDLAGG
jgi:hypothetical protein